MSEKIESGVVAPGASPFKGETGLRGIWNALFDVLAVWSCISPEAMR